MRTAVASLTAVALLVGVILVATASGQPTKKHTPVILDVGDTQGIDSMNPLVGVSVPSYEAWNLQYATLTDKAASDFHPIPGLAKSWTSSADKKTWTYTMKPGLKWSDGQPLTADDVAYTINRARKEQWLNYTSVVQNLTATAPNPGTVVVKTSVPDPKLPTLDIYILPEHVWQKYNAKQVTTYPALDGVGSGPFVLQHFEKGQFARFEANPHYYGGRPKVDAVILRKFDNPDAMVAALKRGELDAAEDVPGTAFKQLEKDSSIQTVQGFQGAMEELAINGGAGLAKPNKALSDPRVREAIAHAIDKKAIVNRVLDGLGKASDTLSVSPSPEWTPAVPPAEQFDFNLAKARQLLDQAGYKDTNGDGIREIPGTHQPLRLRYAERSEGDAGQPTAELITGWLHQIGIATTVKIYDDSALTVLIGKGDYDLFSWGWTPFVDPDPMLSYFTCSQVSHDPKDPTNYYNDANWCDHTYDTLYKEQKTELDHAKRVSLVHQMLLRFHDAAVYDVLYTYPDLQAYVKGRFTGWVRQPAGNGPVIFSNSSPSYARLRPVTGAARSEAGSGSGGLIAGIVVAVLIVAGGVFALRRRRTADERE